MEQAHLSACPTCNGYGIRDSGRKCRTCGGCGELFNGLKFADYRAAIGKPLKMEDVPPEFRLVNVKGRKKG